jgi:ubiquinone/menaquinone biosynthesis C-methylase UbiE
MSQWNRIFKQYGKSFISSPENIPRILKFLRKNNVKRVLDLGCGTGGDVVYLAKQGFEVYGIDVAKEAVRVAKESLKAKKLKANLKVGSIYEELPYEDDFFDAAISIRVIHHAGIKDIRKLIKEIKRILKPKGLIFVTVRKKIPQRSRCKFKVIAPRTYVPLEGNEKGVVHYLFNKELLIKAFKDFKVKDFWIDLGTKSWERYYCLLGELKK